MSNADTDKVIGSSDFEDKISKEMKISRDRLNPIIDYLQVEKLVKKVSWDDSPWKGYRGAPSFIPGISITHLGIKKVEEINNLYRGPTPSFDNGEATTVFISYAREDSEAAARLYQDLKKAALTPWLDKESLIAGQNWKIAINKAIKKSRYFIPIFSSNSVRKRGYVQKEFKFALDVLDEVPESDIFAIPVRLDECEIPYEKLKDIEYVDLFPDWDKGLQRIIQAMKGQR